MRTGFSWIACIASLPILGLSLMGAPPFRSLPLGSRVAVAWGVGAYVLTAVMTVFALLGLSWNPAVVAVVSLVVTAVLRMLASGQEPRPAERDRGPAVLLWLGLTAAGGGVAVGLIAAVTGSSTSADLFLFWGPKGQAFGAAQAIDTTFLTAPFHEYLHPSYPPLLTNLYAFATEIAGRFSWSAATLTYPVVLAALALALLGLLRLSLPPADAAATTAVVICGIALLGNEADIAGNAEIFLLFFEATSMALLISPVAATPPYQMLCGILLGGAAASKVEGLPFVAAAGLSFLALGPRAGSVWRTSTRLGGPTVLVLGSWFAFGAIHRLFFGYEGYGEILTLYPSSLGGVLREIGSRLFEVGYGLPFIVPLILLATRRPPWRPTVVPLATAAALSIFFVFTYLHVPDATQWIEWSAARIFAPLIPLLTLAAVAPATTGSPNVERPATVIPKVVEKLLGQELKVED